MIDLPGAGSSRWEPSTPITVARHIETVRQVVDLAGQVAQAPGVGELTRTCRQLIGAMRRDIVAFDPDRE